MICLTYSVHNYCSVLNVETKTINGMSWKSCSVWYATIKTGELAVLLARVILINLFDQDSFKITTFDSSSWPSFCSRRCVWKCLQNVCHIVWLFSGFFVDVLARILFGSSLAHWQLYNYHVAHDDVIIWKQFPCYWPFVRGIHRSPVNSPHKGQWRRTLIFSLICAWINGLNNHEAGDLRPHRPHYDVTVMYWSNPGGYGQIIRYQTTTKPTKERTLYTIHWMHYTARLRYLQCVCNEDTAVLHKDIDMG